MRCTKFVYQTEVVKNQNLQLLCYVTDFYVCHHCGTVTHKNDKLLYDPIHEYVHSQLNCLHLQDIDMENEVFCPSCRYASTTSSWCICEQGKRWRGLLERDFRCQSLMLPTLDTMQALLQQMNWCCRAIHGWKLMWLQLLLERLHPCTTPKNKLFQRDHVAYDLLPHLYWGIWEMEKNVHHFLKSDNLGVHWTDPLPDDVYQYPKILSLAGWL